MSDKLTITLTDRPPVKIVRDEWPVIASASDERWDNTYKFQANRTWEWRITVRQHADRRTLVYAVYEYDTCYENEPDSDHRAGVFLSPDGDVIAAIQQVGSDMEGRVGDGVFARLVHECVAGLPAIEI